MSGQRVPHFLVTVENTQHFVPVDESPMGLVVNQIVADAGFRAGYIEIAVVDDPTIHELNAAYLGHDYATDVLAFEIEKDAESAILEGNIMVSGETARRRCVEFGTTASDELLLYVIHGTLHLVGYDDHTPDDAAIMREKERIYSTASKIKE